MNRDTARLTLALGKQQGLLAKREDGTYLGLEWKPNGRAAAN